MAKNNRSSLNPFTGKKHYDTVDDDKFLQMCYNTYYEDVNNSVLIDHTSDGQIVLKVASHLISTVEEFLTKIDRYDYVEDYYDWEFHLSQNEQANAYCMPGGKIMVYSGIFQIANSEERLAFILGHEIAHALLDHSRTKFSVEQTKNTLTTVSWIGSFALDLMGLGGAGSMARAAVNAVDIGSHFFLTQPWGRDQEYEADKLGMILIHMAGYDITGIPSFWQEFSGNNASFDFFSTHPSDDKRIAVMRESLDEILSENDFYSKPVLPETPSPKKQYKIDNSNISQIHQTSTFKARKNMTCPKCGSAVESGDIFCIFCGNKIEKENPLACPECGFIASSQDNFCKNCGYKLFENFSCSRCGEKVSKDQSFCTNCGNKLI